jgi:aminoglycoside phosphotransferase (APT) family kinase protein
MAPHERGWSGAALARFRVFLQNGTSLTLITKTMGRNERRVMHLLSSEGHAHTPFAYVPDLEREGPCLVCMQDVGSTKMGIPLRSDDRSPSAAVNQQVAAALASIHLHYRGRGLELGWLPPADAPHITGRLLTDMWRSRWDEALQTNPAFAREFGHYTPHLEAAGACLRRTVASLWQEATSLTLTHGDLHGDHVLLWHGHPYFIDWDWAAYGPFYLDLPALFTPSTVHHYREALVAQGLEISEPDFMERYHQIGRYVGFRYLCSGIWEWQAAPKTIIGRRLLLTIKWALDGTWPHRAFSVPDDAWHQLTQDHARGVLE